MHILIVDDETRARNTLINITKIYCPEVQTISTAANVQTAVEIIQQQTVDIVLLDVRLGNESGFDVLQQTAYKDLNVIFITAYNEYAIKAFKVSAIDYLLKPIDPDEFAQAIEKAKKKVQQSMLTQRLNLVLQTMENQHEDIKKLTLKTNDSIHIVPTSDIIYCAAERSYTTFYLMHGKKIMVSKTLGDYENLLPKNSFIRPHQSYLVNLNHIVRYDKGDKNVLVTIEDHHIPVAVRKKEMVMQTLSN